MKKNSTFNITFVLTVILFLAQADTSSAQIANNYPNDSLINTDPNVVFTEMFEHSTVNAMITSTTPNYQTSPMLSHIDFAPSVPPGSHGMQSLKLTTVENSTASNDQSEDANILKKFSTGINDSIFVRYYVKFNNAHTFHHTGVWIGGTNPTNLCWPCNYPGRTIPTNGDSAFVIGTEIRDSANHFAKNYSKFGFYNYWMDMKPLTLAPNAGKYFGNEFISPNPVSTIDMSAWNCVEIMLKLNNPVSDSTGELKLWINGQLLAHYGKGFPNGTWNQATFNEGAGSPFDGYRWRSNPAVVFNYIWIKNYATDNSAYPTANDVLFDHIVVAKNYIGPIYDPPCTTPIISSFSPTAASTSSTISITGSGFNNATTLSINGIALSFSVVNDNLINTTIPANVTTGQFTIGSSCGMNTSTTSFIVLPNKVPITVKLFLEGFYTNGKMISAIGDNTTPIANCDTIIMNLADTISPYQIQYSDTQLLKTNGFATFNFPQSVNNNPYYFVIRHRNSLETWSKKPILITSTLSVFDFTVSTTPTATTTVDKNNVVMTNPKLLLGITYDCRSSLTIPNYGLAGYHNTDGSWNSNIATLFNDFPMSTLRYPANGIMQGFNWKKSIGPISTRVPQKIFAPQGTPAQVLEFGFDEFMAMTESRGVNGSDVQIMVPIYDSAVVWSMPAQNQAAVPYVAQLNADWVEYCNSPNNGTNPGGGTDWAAVRAANGHPQPYGIKIWNMGNEPYTSNEFGASATGANNYINIIVPIINAMRSIDPSIQITVTSTGRYNSAWVNTILNSTSLQGKIYGLNVHFFMTEQLTGNTIPNGVDTVTDNLTPLAAAALSKGYKLLVGDHAHAIQGTNPNQAMQDLAMQWQGANLTSDFILSMSQIKNIERSNFWVYGLTTNTWHPIRKNTNGTYTLMPVAQLYKILSPLFLDKSVSVTNTSVPASDGNVYSVKSSAFASNDLTKLNVISVNRDKLKSSLFNVQGLTGYNLNNAKLLTATSLSSDVINETAINVDINDNFTLPPMSVLILEYSTN